MTTPSLTATVFPRVSRIPAVLRDVLRQEAVFLGIIAGYVAIVVAVGVILDRPALAGFLSYFQRSLALVIVVPFAMVVNARIRDIKAGVPASLDAYKKALREVVETKLTAKALTRFVAVFVPLMVFLAAFSGYKQMFYLFTGYTWDAPFAVLDRVLHGGYDPWVLTDMVLHSQWATIITDRIYFGLWAMAMMGVTVWELWHEESPRRKQYLITFVLSWIIIGSLLPTLFPSGGPTYYTEFTGEPSFIATHKEYLRSIPGLSAVTIQD